MDKVLSFPAGDSIDLVREFHIHAHAIPPTYSNYEYITFRQSGGVMRTLYRIETTRDITPSLDAVREEQKQLPQDQENRLRGYVDGRIELYDSSSGFEKDKKYRIYFLARDGRIDLSHEPRLIPNQQGRYYFKLSDLLSGVPRVEIASKSSAKSSFVSGSAVPAPVPEDIGEPPSEVEVITYRKIRDTKLARDIKELYNNECQLCSHTIKLADGRRYAEVHHIVPLGAGGLDEKENIICVCPNHHVLLDYKAIQLDLDTLTLKQGHKIKDEYVQYHNSRSI